MKLALFLCCALALLTGAGLLLLRTSQAPFSALQATAVTKPAPAAEPAPAALTANPAEANPGAKHYTKEEFRALGESSLRQLPGKETLAALKEGDAFTAPLPILRAGEVLGPIAAAVHEDELLSEEATVIYRTCAASGDYPDSVRALCLHHFRRLTRKNGKPTPEGFAPSFIRELAAKLSS
ncbi:MAG: hypothetical protein EOP11_22205 [Proteobacteria bacterium]|nr:MAG: hypothetical protein EOP11_22205 [Pseudomonadota bacterium]